MSEYGAARRGRSYPEWVGRVLDDSHLAKDTLAIVDRGGTRIQFVVSSPATLTADNYEVLMWDTDYMLVGLSDKYLNTEFDAKIVNTITEEVGTMAGKDQDTVEEYVKMRSVELLRETLEHIIDDLIVSDKTPSYTANVDMLISRLLSED